MRVLPTSSLILVAMAQTAPACPSREPSGLDAPHLRVVLEARTSSARDLPASMIPGDRLALVHMDGAPRVTLHSVPAAGAREDLKRALESDARPARSGELLLHLPLPPESLSDTFLDVVFFADRNSNEQLDEGEPYVSAWNGGRGSYRGIFLRAPHPDLPGSAAGWNLCEGGEPMTCTSDLLSRVVALDPVMRGNAG